MPSICVAFMAVHDSPKGWAAALSRINETRLYGVLLLSVTSHSMRGLEPYEHAASAAMLSFLFMSYQHYGQKEKVEYYLHLP